MLIYHIVRIQDWTPPPADHYQAESLQSEGFIHCSFKEQIPVVLKRYYAGLPKVILLTIDPERLTSKLVNERSTGGEVYPHIYGPINREAIVQAEELEPGTIAA